MFGPRFPSSCLLGVRSCLGRGHHVVPERRSPRARIRGRVVRLGLLLAGLLITLCASAVPSAGAAPTAMVDLGGASSYAVLSGASVGNTVNGAGAPHTTLRGDLGVKPNTQPTGFPPGVVTGATEVGTPAAAQAFADLVSAYNEVAGRAGGVPLAGDLAGLTLAPGLHSSAAAVSNTGTVTLDAGGDPNAVFVFKIGGALTMAAGAHVVLANGARASRVFWQVGGAAAVGAGDSFAGTVMALDAVAMGAGTVVNGRVLSRNGAISLDSNDVYSAPPVITITGGGSAITTDTTPTVTGTTDVLAPGVVTVTVNGQTLTTTSSDGTWSVTSAILANGTYPVVASVTDGAGNPGAATQSLTVDTVPPVVTIDGGPSRSTNDRTPTIAGTSDAVPGTIIRISVDAQSLTALVQAGGTWNVAPSALPDGTRTVSASVTDPAGNDGTDSQVLTVDTTAPAVAITGGATALTNDATPEITGLTDAAPGTTVTVTLADQTLTGEVQADGAWSVTAAKLSDGPHRIVLSVSDAAGNSGSATQQLTVDTVAPVVTITGGATASTPDTDPTIRGTADAAPGTTVRVSIAGQTITTLLQPNGTWNATPAPVGFGVWPIIASAADPAGNSGSARQTLTIAPPGSPKPPATGHPAPKPPATPPTSKQMLAALAHALTPRGSGAKIAAILKVGGYAVRVRLLRAGTETITWYEVPKGAHVAAGRKAKPKPIVVATGTRRLTKAGTATLRLKLTRRGKALLRKVARGRRLALTAKASFTPKGGRKIAKTQKIGLRR